MSTKVVHLEDQVHEQAKEFCKKNRLRMSEWVTSLIVEAITEKRSGGAGKAAVLKRRVSFAHGADNSNIEEQVPVYAAPPFWAARATR